MKNLSKRAFTLLLSIFMFVGGIGIPAFASAETTDYSDEILIAPSVEKKRSGDVDGSGSINVDDARLVLRLAVKLSRCSDSTRQYADADGDDNVSVADARLVLRVAVKLDKADVLAEFVPIDAYKNDENYYYWSYPDVEDYTMTEGETKTFDDVIVRKNQKTKWESSNPTAVSVTQKGEIKALKKGFSCIILTVGEDKFYYDITVRNELQNKIDKLRDKYPDGYYWNNNPASKKYPAVTETPCTDHSTGAYSKCKGQCAGFADLMSSEIFGNAQKKYGVTWNTVKIGDYLRLKKHHSVFVIDVVKKGDIVGYDHYNNKNYTAENTYVKVVHCNWYWSCDIQWDKCFYSDEYELDSSLSYTKY